MTRFEEAYKKWSAGELSLYDFPQAAGLPTDEAYRHLWERRMFDTYEEQTTQKE